MSGGVALFDFDNDGLLDIYFDRLADRRDGQGPEGRAQRALSQRWRVAIRGRHRQGRRRTSRAGRMGSARRTSTATAGRTSTSPASDGTTCTATTATALSPISTAAAGVAGGGWSTGCGFADYDRDGDLDLFVSRYVKIDLDHCPSSARARRASYRGIAVQCGPRGLPGEADFLFRNDGNGRSPRSARRRASPTPRSYFGLGIAWLDFNDDGWLDLFVANDSGPNFLYLNQKDGTFKNLALPDGRRGERGRQRAGQHGRRRGRLRQQRTPEPVHDELRRGVQRPVPQRRDHFTDVSFRSKTAPSSLPYVGWGTTFFDYDNDGLLDLIAVNGHVYPQLDKSRLGAVGRATGSGSCSTTTAATGPSTRWRHSSARR